MIIACAGRQIVAMGGLTDPFAGSSQLFGPPDILCERTECGDRHFHQVRLLLSL